LKSEVEEIRYTYEEVEERVQAYLRGDPEAASVLIETFNGFLIRWMQVISGNASYECKPHRTFVALYVQQKTSRIRIANGDGRGSREFGNWCGNIKDRYAGLDRTEKWHELVLCLLDLADRYDPYEGYRQYHTYVLRSFPYYLHRRLEEHVKDISCFSQTASIDQTTEEGWTIYEIPVNDKVELDKTWVKGMTAGAGFAELTPVDRKILIDYYELQMNDREIGAQLGVGRCSVNRRRIQAIEKLKKSLENENMLDWLDPERKRRTRSSQKKRKNSQS